MDHRAVDRRNTLVARGEALGGGECVGEGEPLRAGDPREELAEVAVVVGGLSGGPVLRERGGRDHQGLLPLHGTPRREAREATPLRAEVRGDVGGVGHGLSFCKGAEQGACLT